MSRRIVADVATPRETEIVREIEAWYAKDKARTEPRLTARDRSYQVRVSLLLEMLYRTGVVERP